MIYSDSEERVSDNENVTEQKEIDLNGEKVSDNERNEANLENKVEVKMPVFNPMKFIKNKDRRNALYKKIKLEKMKKKKIERRKRQKEGTSGKGGHTIESLREVDQTAIGVLDDSENEELRNELDADEFSTYFNKSYEPKIFITFSDNPTLKGRKFGLELSRVFPNSLVKVRNRSSIKNMVKGATKAGFSDIIIINENRRQPNGLLIIHLPDGPTALFKLSNVKLTKDLRRSHKEISKHRPEVILTNFTTRLGLTVGRMLGSLFHHDPEFHGRRVVTFHNQRDYIFFRHHRYVFTADDKRAKLRELGPRFTLKLRSLQEGTFDSKCGDYKWIITNKRHAMEGRRRFYL